jgi:hypothetical protein
MKRKYKKTAFNQKPVSIEKAISDSLNPAWDVLDAYNRICKLEDLVIDLVKSLNQNAIDRFMAIRGYVPEEDEE